jgi:hypothetical protein
MNEKQLFDSFNRLFNNETINKLKMQSIYKDGNVLRLFEQYEILQNKYGFKVSKIGTDANHTFSNLQYAVTWAVLDKRNLIYEQNRVRDLDIQLSGLDVVLKSGENARKKTKIDFVRHNKLTEARYKKTLMLEEMQKYVAQTKNWQIKKFKESSL